MNRQPVAVKSSGEMQNIVYFDLETQKSAAEVGGWDKISEMRMSIGVTYSTQTGKYTIYSEQRVHDLVKELQRADLVVGFNILRFDYDVLHGYTTLDMRQLPTLDLLVSLTEVTQRKLPLDAYASATLGVEKIADGMQALQWYKEGRLVEIAEYCCYDVKLTRLLHEYGRQHKKVFYNTRFGDKVEVPVNW